MRPDDHKQPASLTSGKPLRKLLAISFAALVLMLVIALHSEQWTEINRATGASRTRVTRSWIFANPWVETPTWLSVRATELGLETGSQWQQITHHTIGITGHVRGCSTAPVSFNIHLCDESHLSPAELDRFVQVFVTATEAEREALIEKLSSDSFRVP